MNETNAVRQYLISTGNQALLGAGATADTLAAGQIGVFDKDTNLSIAAATVPKNFYIVVGGTATKPIETATYSAGNKITTAFLNNYDKQAYVAPVAQVVKMNGFQSVCETEYILKVQATNSEITRREYPNRHIHSYSVVTGTCDGCTTCPSNDPNVLIKSFYDQITLAAPPYFTVSLLDAGGGALVGAAIDAYITANQAANTDGNPATDVVMQLVFTSIPVEKNLDTGDIDWAYYHTRGTQLSVSMPLSASNTEVVTETTALVIEQGSGYDLRMEEYEAGGYNGRPGAVGDSRLSNFTHISTGFLYFSDVAANYKVTQLGYDVNSRGALETYTYHNQTAIAIPTGDAVTIAALEAILDPIAASVGL